ncbi:MAG: nucleoside monophosphate kinase [Candidatus Nanohaloarchaeota archaeon QJJ-5]|nr:nucleoside monophosphate kinase [Candidatus Nanohaloarchaeota archaeon QJJ-5]
MRIAFIGPPGAGKTTQAEKTSDLLDVPVLTTGNILRDHKHEQTRYGTPAEYMETGRLVPDELINHIVDQQLQEPTYSRGVVFDGYPRTVNQAEHLHDRHPLDVVFLLEVQDHHIIDRINERLICPNCQKSYHLNYNPPKVYGVCDSCGTELTRREDDTQAILEEKIQTYREQTKALMEVYQAYGILQRIQADSDIETTWHQIKKVIQQMQDSQQQG